MNIIDIIDKKRKGEELTDEEVGYVVNGYVNGNILDYQMSSLLMAITINDMTDREVYSLTKYMLNSGNKIDLSMFDMVCDKHSTGGVGDKTTLIISPIVASCGVSVAKMSGRGLGYTGGTIDKLEAIPSFNVNLTREQFIKEIKDIGMSIVSQTEDLVIADKKIYALRDVTGTVSSIPLIASSIMSKKIACGAKNLVIDLKLGSGALIDNISDARRLANLMVNIGKNYGMRVICLITNMDIPLGHNIGNSIEVQEAMDVLLGKNSGNLFNLCVELSSYMVSLGRGISVSDAKSMVLDSISKKKAYNKFLEFVKYQNGDISKLDVAKYKYEVRSKSEGYLVGLDALSLAKISFLTGSGRKKKDDVIDYSSGVIINKDINDYVKVGDVIYTIYSNKKIEDVFYDCYTISNKKNDDIKLIYEIVGL